MKPKRMTVRVVERDKDGTIWQVIEQEMPENFHQVELFLRRAPFREAAAAAMIRGGTITIERKND